MRINQGREELNQGKHLMGLFCYLLYCFSEEIWVDNRCHFLLLCWGSGHHFLQDKKEKFSFTVWPLILLLPLTEHLSLTLSLSNEIRKRQKMKRRSKFLCFLTYLWFQRSYIHKSYATASVLEFRQWCLKGKDKYNSRAQKPVLLDFLVLHFCD